MTNAFGGFLHASPLSNLTSSTSRPPDPASALASNCVRDHFGPVVQTVADALRARGPSTLHDLVATVRNRCSRDWNRERGRLVDRVNGTVGAKESRDAPGEAKEGAGTPSELYYRGGRVAMNKARGSEAGGYVTDASHVRAALLVLLQHSLVEVSGGGGGKNAEGGSGDPARRTPDPTSSHTRYTYAFLHDRARLMPRYPRYVDHARKVADDRAAQIVESLLIHGRMRGEDAILDVWEQSKGESRKDGGEEEAEGGDDDKGEGDKALKEIVASFRKLVEGGYVEAVVPIATNEDMDDIKRRREVLREDGIHGGEVEFKMDEESGTIAIDKKKEKKETKKGKKRPRPDPVPSVGSPDPVPSIGSPDPVTSNGSPTTKRQKGGAWTDGEDAPQSEEDDDREDSYGSSKPHHPRILSLLSSHRALVPPGSVFRVNPSAFHASLRASVLGRLTSEMYPDAESSNKRAAEDDEDVAHVGDVVRAALTHAARQEHAPSSGAIDESEEDRHRRMAEWGTFSPPDLIPHLSPETTSALRSKVGGVRQNLSTLLASMSRLNRPPVLTEVEEARGHPLGGKFEVCARQLLRRARDRIAHRVVASRRGAVAARIVSILQARGHRESEAIGDDALVPAKEAREQLHRLHKDGYVDLFDMHVTKTHNTGTAIYLWDVMPERLARTVADNVCEATLNLRLRRQHEVEVGKEWMDRAREAGAAEENVHEEDKKKYHAFCKGLERLDCALLQLDETLMVLKDF